ncbi:MAG: type IV pilus assembly protein PilB [Candidatus Berkelbacteria bacterium Athens1014_28]|uniref:Type IV pilus assembly protein PilB n=1 Tax=Candidatus Berkelbacteria bacterium Athens1014_28 TaxID=2017145 RepID=A0A554LLC1_9BACT|nr:MAG: type IV pilus assembly protein PilB [Candidatus Berkelbacteria bacterium Athens1014_28]
MVNLDRKLFSMRRQDEEEQVQALSRQLSLPYIDLVGYPFAAEIFSIFPADIMLRYSFVPYLKIGHELRLATTAAVSSDLQNYLDEFAKATNYHFTFSLVSKTGFLYALNQLKIKQDEAREKTENLSEKKEGMLEKIKVLADIEALARKVSTSELLDLLLASAAKLGASDIHIEPEENEFLIRYRIDGVLQDVFKMPKSAYKFLLSRIKFLAKLKLDIVAAPQDGRFSFKSEIGNIDLRVSTLPSAFGESVVLRLLGQEIRVLKLEDLGFRPDALSLINQAISRPHGMILNTGPTGSGKTTTLYAMIVALKKPGIKIISLEDPIEYRIDGVEQSQVDPVGGYTFANGLRAALRQDPDILMVGEIRDKETAEIGVQAAITGHLFLTSLHSNTASGALPRLLEIGVRPFLLAGSINLIMGQRLVRKICTKCREEFSPSEVVWDEIKKILAPIMSKLPTEISAKLNLPANQIKLWRGVGCSACGKTGYLGRQVIVEALVPSPAMEELISKQATIAEFSKLAIDEGMITMEQDGLIKVLQGATTTTEVWRVTKD